MTDFCREAQERAFALASAIDQLPEAQWVVDNNLILKGFNQAFSKLCKREPQPGHSLVDVITGDVSCWTHYYAQAMTGKEFCVEHPFRSKDCGTRVLRLRLQPLMNKGSVCEIVASVSEQERDNGQGGNPSQFELEMAAVYRAKSELMASMNHSLRTPLNHVIGYTEMLLEDLCNMSKEEIASNLCKVQRSGKQLLGLINNIVAMANAEKDRSVVAIEEFDVQLLLQDAVANVEKDLAERNDWITVDTVGSSNTIRTDRDKLCYVLSYLLRNACRFTKDSEITLSVSDTPSGTTFSVADRGVGIRKELCDALNEAFSSKELASFPKEEGIGLGFPLVHRYCQLLNGQLEVRSGVGEGAVFSLTLVEARQ